MGLDNVRVLIRELIEHCWILMGIFQVSKLTATHLIGGIVQLVKVSSCGGQPGHYLSFHSKHNQTLDLIKCPGPQIMFAIIG